MKRRFAKAVKKAHEMSTTPQAEVVKFLTPWPIAAASAIIGFVVAMRLRAKDQHVKMGHALLGASLDAVAAFPKAHLVIRGSGLIYHAVKHTHAHVRLNGIAGLFKAAVTEEVQK